MALLELHTHAFLTSACYADAMDNRALHTPPDAEPATVRELLTYAFAQPELGQGYFANVYALPFPGFENFLLRVHKVHQQKGSLNEALENSTALTPIKKLVANTHLGQHLMDIGNDASIVLRQNGVSMTKLHEQLSSARMANGEHKRPAKENAWTETIERILNLSHNQNPFIPVFEKLYANSCAGFDCDLSPDNLFIDEEHHTLELIDQYNQPCILVWESSIKTLMKAPMKTEFEDIDEHFIHAVKKQFSHAPHRSETGERRSVAAAKLTALATEAKEHVLAAHANDKPGEYHGLAFADVSNVKAVSLDDPPRVLVERLNQLVALGNIPLR
jgi:hypothetical protein